MSGDMKGTRHLIALALGIFVLIVLAFDFTTSSAPNIFQAPPAVALGSGQASHGAHCTALPSGD